MKLFKKGYWISKSYKWLSVIYWTSYSIYFRSLTFFSVANPIIYLGGMLDEKKSDIYSLIPDQYLPTTRVYRGDTQANLSAIRDVFEFPLIVKPNVGYRGFLVKRVDDATQLAKVIAEFEDKEYIVQDFLKEPREYSVLYYYVDESDFGVSSLVEKHLPFIVGDGLRNVQQLILALKNPFLNMDWVMKRNEQELSDIPEKGKRMIVDHIGNYARGSKFESLNAEIDDQLVESMRAFYKQVKGMQFCRMDVKADSLMALKQGDFKILEINGAKSEPLHIYDRKSSFLDVAKITHRHWTTLFRVVKKNIRHVEFPSSMEGIKSYFSLKKMVN